MAVIEWSQWRNQPLVIDALIVLAWLYALLAGPLRSRLAPSQPWPCRRALRFYSGLLVFYLAVGSPLSRVGSLYLFSVHIVLQMLIMYPAAALILTGLPDWMIDPLLGRPAARRLAAHLLRPFVTGASFALLVSLWYIPRIFGWAQTHRFGPAVEASVFFVASLLFWWPILSPSRLFPRLAYGGRMVYLFCLEVALTGVFTYLLMAEHALYPVYELAPRMISELSPENDQVLGGVLLSGISSLVLVGALAMNFFRWARTEEETKTTKPERFV